MNRPRTTSAAGRSQTRWRQLGAAKRVVVVLHYWLDLPLEEIAGVLGLPIGTVASRLARAKEELRGVLEAERVV